MKFELWKLKTLCVVDVGMSGVVVKACHNTCQCSGWKLRLHDILRSLKPFSTRETLREQGPMQWRLGCIWVQIGVELSDEVHLFTCGHFMEPPKTPLPSSKISEIWGSQSWCFMVFSKNIPGAGSYHWRPFELIHLGYLELPLGEFPNFEIQQRHFCHIFPPVLGEQKRICDVNRSQKKR